VQAGLQEKERVIVIAAVEKTNNPRESGSTFPKIYLRCKTGTRQESRRTWGKNEITYCYWTTKPTKSKKVWNLEQGKRGTVETLTAKGGTLDGSGGRGSTLKFFRGQKGKRGPLAQLNREGVVREGDGNGKSMLVAGRGERNGDLSRRLVGRMPMGERWSRDLFISIIYQEKGSCCQAAVVGGGDRREVPSLLEI